MFKIASIVALGFLAVSPAWSYEVPLSTLASIHPEAERVVPIRIEFEDHAYNSFVAALKAKTSFDQRVIHGYAPERTDGDRWHPMGHSLFVDEIGKDRPITFLVSVSPSGEVLDLQVVHYRETRGGEIRAKPFLKQYEGKSREDSFSSIKIIRGATLSAYAANRAVLKAIEVVGWMGRPGVSVTRGQAERLDKSSRLERTFVVGDTILTVNLRCSPGASLSCPEALHHMGMLAVNWFKRFEEWRKGDRDPELVQLVRRADRYKASSGGVYNLAWAKPESPSALDFGSVYKGFIVDRLDEYAGRVGYDEYLISMGESTFFVRGSRQVFELWGETVVLADAGLSVSVSSGGYGISVDARTGARVAGHRVAYAIHRMAEASDALSTACVIDRVACAAMSGDLGAEGRVFDHDR